MNSTDAIRILESCIDELKNMTVEEFENIKIKRGIDESNYSNRSYSQGEVQLVLPGTSEYQRFIEEETFSFSISIEYQESFESSFEFKEQKNVVDSNIANAA